VVLACIASVLFIAKRSFAYLKHGAKLVGNSTTKFVAQELGEPMQKDELGHINALIVGYSGIENRG
jgi:hypothetical protein